MHRIWLRAEKFHFAPMQFTRAQVLRAFLVVGAVLSLAATLSLIFPLGADYAIYQAISDQVLDGTDLYTAGTRYYDAPWLLVILLPLTRLPSSLGQAILGTASVLMAIGAAHVLRQSARATFLGLVLGLANLHTFSLLFRGQVDALVLLGVGLGWAAVSRGRPWLLAVAFWLLSTKPPNVLLVIVLFLWAIRHWPWRDWLRAFSLVGISLLASLVIAGADWPLRYVQYLRATPPGLINMVVSLWRAADVFDIPAWLFAAPLVLCVCLWGYWVKRTGITLGALALALATNFLFSPYALGYHFIILLPALVYVAAEDERLALAAYVCTWTPLARLWGGFDITWIDASYPLLLLAAVWSIELRARRARAFDHLPTALRHAGN